MRAWQVDPSEASATRGWAAPVNNDQSMTGFASTTPEDERATIGVTIRALNHRHLDLQLRVPQSLSAIERDIRALVGSARRARAGRAEPVAAAARRAGRRRRAQRGLRTALEAALNRARDRGLVTGALTPGDLLRLPQALTIRERQAEPTTS